MKKTRFECILYVTGIEFDSYDLWGSALGLHFDICEVLDASDIEGDVTPEPFKRWVYQRGMHTVPALEDIAGRDDDGEFHEGEFTGDYSFNSVMLASALLREDITQEDLIYAGDVLSKYCALLRANGHDY